MEAEFIIETGHKYFLDWLEAYASKYGRPDIHTQDTDILCGIDHPVIIHEGGWILIHAPATLMKAVGNDDNIKFVGEEIEPIIRFNLLPLSETRTKIVASWYEAPEIGGLWHAADNSEIEGFQVVDDYMRHLLGMIENDWPEAKGSIEQALSTNIGAGATLNEDRIVLGGGYSEEILVPINVLDVSASRRIEGYTAELATAERHEIVPGGRIIYRLSWRELGRIGEVELHKSDENATWLTVRYVRPVDRGVGDEIKKHMDLVIRALHAGLAEDGIWENHEKEIERRDKASVPEREQPAWELAQQFNFNADAADICAYIMGSENWREANYREIDVTDGQFVMRAVLSAEPGINALYSIAILGGTQDGTEFTYDKGENWLLSPTTHVGEIALVQEGLGNCTAQLYVEMNPRRLESDHNSLWRITPSLVTLLWHQLIEEWRKRISTVSEKTERTYVEPGGEAVTLGAEEDTQSVEPARKSKRGPRRYSVEEKLKALDDWERLDKDRYPINLDEWLEERFGTDGGVLNVAVSTFYGWKRYRDQH